MKIHLISIGNKMPEWVNEGFSTYAKRLPPECSVDLIQIPAEKRSKNADLKRIQKLEGDKLLAAIPKHSLVAVLAIQGKAWDTEQLAEHLSIWQRNGQAVSLLIGGPEGLSQACYERADLKWSLSPLTFPHPLVRIIVVEQIYRAWSILKNHPYHR